MSPVGGAAVQPWCLPRKLPLLNHARASSFTGFGGVALAYPVFVAYCVLLTSAAAALTTLAPAAAGSGIPQVKAELNGVRVPGADCASAEPRARFATSPATAANRSTW